MAEFCKQCSLDLFGVDYEDFKGLTTQEDWVSGLAATVLCESCGVIQVDPEGKCIILDCEVCGNKV